MTDRQSHWRALATSVLVAGSMAGCAGSGEGLDSNGRPLGESTPPPPSDNATFSQIQETIFTPVCTGCHAGASAPMGLRLDAGSSYALLVNVPSVQVPGLLRVNPGNPDASYLVHKIEGRAAVGQRMPLGGPALTQDQIDLVRQWIAAGATAPASAASLQDQPLRLSASIPAADEASLPIDAITLIFSHALDASLAASGVFSLRASGGDGSFAEGNERAVAISQIHVPSAGPTVAVLRLAETLGPEDYELRIVGTGATALTDVDARVLDGDEDGIPGGDHRLMFAIEATHP